jgi:hypothetical protein
MPQLQQSKSLLRRLVEARYRPNSTRQKIIIKHQQQKQNRIHEKRNIEKYWTGVYKGIYYRIPKIATTSISKGYRPLPVIPKLYTPTSPPANLPSLKAAVIGDSCNAKQSTMTKSTIIPAVVRAVAKTLKYGDQQKRNEFYERLIQWLRDNYGTLILNFGSICTLIGFTRSDVLELRYLSVTGSLCAIVYHIATPPLRIPPLVWSSTFAFVNGYKIYEIVQEREGSVQLSTEQEEMYSNFFMPHGVTPKQFEMIYAKAEVIHMKKGTYLIRQNEAYQHVDLVVAGTTRASALGRFLTAASTTPTAREERVGGASGAWIGEMCLLERVWVKEQKSTNVQSSSLVQTRTSKPLNIQSQPEQQPLKPEELEATKQAASNFTDTGSFETNDSNKMLAKSTPPTNDIQPNNTMAEGSKVRDSIDPSEERKIPRRKPTETVSVDQMQQQKLKACRSMYTIVAQEDCVVLRWRHDAMESLMKKSTDMRAALTRAMTAAIVGKVINFTVSRSKAAQTWATWLGDWKYNAGAEVYIDDDPKVTKTNTVMDSEATLSAKENLPNYPIRSFR